MHRLKYVSEVYRKVSRLRVDVESLDNAHTMLLLLPS